jgi:N-acetylglucosamine kinase-like BadF-type ATPase
MADIAAAGFGLAGLDLPSQEVELRKRVENIGFSCYGLANDGILGIKGASDSGVGLCAVNGTGTVIIGADEMGKVLQVGGVGPLSGDYAGGGYIRNEIISKLYDYYYRCGADSSMFPKLMELLAAKPEDMLTLVSDSGLIHKNTIAIIQLCDKAAMEGDNTARLIFDAVGKTIGFSASGCIKNLTFKESPIDIVLVGSIWQKIGYKGMKESFVSTVEGITSKKVNCITLDAPAAVGGVLWAKEKADKASVPADYRRHILETITMEKYESQVFSED